MVDATPITKKKKGSKGLPKGITEHQSKKLQARGAPLSHKAKTKSDSHVEPTAAEQQGPLVQPKQLTTVPLPCAIEDINNSEMQAFFASGNA
mmetsp:Transcript_36549/g.92625  ORF Transcript_36549/g.92625 Transcript_36549/m.92625 type:complete len:92 (+) Transcript_36549:270-545(+)